MKELRVEILAQPNKILRHTSNFQVLTLADLGDLLIQGNSIAKTPIIGAYIDLIDAELQANNSENQI